MLCCINLVLRPKSRRYGRPFRLFTSRLSSSTGGLELLCRMNAGKPGRPFQYPEILLRGWLASTPSCRCPTARWRRFVRRLATFLPRSRGGGLYHPLSAGSSAWISRYRDVIIAVDSTGGEGVREKWRVRRGWITVHGKINVETRSHPEVDDPMYRAVRCPGSTAARSTLCIGCRVTETRDRNDLFNTLEERGILAGTDAATRSTGSRPTGPNACDVVAGHRLRHAIGRSKRSSPASNRSSGDGSGDVTGGDAPRGKDGIERL